MRPWFTRAVGFAVTAMLVAFGSTAHADPVEVRYPQGFTHGYLGLKTLQGKLIATGELMQSVRGDRVTSRLTFRFRDGSVDDDTTVYTQNKVSASSAIITFSVVRPFQSRSTSWSMHLLGR